LPDLEDLEEEFWILKTRSAIDDVDEFLSTIV